MATRTKHKELALMACVLNPFTKGLKFLSPSEKELGNKLLLENAQNVSLGKFIVKKGTPSTLCLLIQINQMPPLSSMDNWLQDIMCMGESDIKSACCRKRTQSISALYSYGPRADAFTVVEEKLAVLSTSEYSCKKISCHTSLISTLRKGV